MVEGWIKRKREKRNGTWNGMDKKERKKRGWNKERVKRRREHVRKTQIATACDPSALYFFSFFHWSPPLLNPMALPIGFLFFFFVLINKIYLFNDKI